MSIKFVTDYPAAYVSEIKSLVVADVQIGLEHELYEHGIMIQPQAIKFANVVNKLLKITKAKQLIVLGDLKHKVPGISMREMKHVPIFFENIATKKIILCKGNHDTDLEGLIPDNLKVYDSDGFHIGKYGFFHGHAWPSEKTLSCNHLFMGHLQPGIEFSDKFGHRLIEQVWVKTKLDVEKIKKRFEIKQTGKLETIILPAFNPLLGCAILNKMVPADYEGPFLKNSVINLKESEIYLLDGTLLGKLKEIR